MKCRVIFLLFYRKEIVINETWVFDGMESCLFEKVIILLPNVFLF